MTVMPNARHEMILKLISEQEISTQEMLRSLLEQRGFPVTQATISRDIRQLGLRKKRTAKGVSIYIRSNKPPAAPISLLKDVVYQHGRCGMPSRLCAGRLRSDRPDAVRGDYRYNRRRRHDFYCDALRGRSTFTGGITGSPNLGVTDAEGIVH